ncbi:hypothetical protein [Campylobacter sp. MIT 97-5078]|uniref:hypothetical protein n=1 Tax=Campylobacter sp. MIT 97-5078 TaxID=1548153 RepID=UPI0005144777|nr:hypothetical protein [Campylobacter sp. MIT 97-5078]KGI55247.1 hypothetical protein LR59_12815 [Campylobacter sp. MIT 97-5078]TQR27922.1 hypothetical protein DMB91_01410 [Campylobacter sp. MIT 97-5078]
MQKFKLEDMIRGWFVGNFSPCAFKSESVEVGIKSYKKGKCEQRHFHKVATELTAIISGKVKMNGTVYEKGDIVLIKPNESTDFEALEDSINVVVKLPAAKDDKYLGQSND